MNIMSAGMGGMLCIGTGIGLALFANSNWWWQGLIAAVIIVALHIIFKSENLKDTKANCKDKNVDFTYKSYIAMNFVLNSVIILTSFGIINLIKFLF